MEGYDELNEELGDDMSEMEEPPEEEYDSDVAIRRKGRKPKKAKGGRDKGEGGANVPKPKKWGPHARDRVIRALQEFGFGRWSKIQQEGLATDREVQDIEAFCRSYVLQCGLCAGESTQTVRNESKFVTDAISAAQRLLAQMKHGEVAIPPILQDVKFVAKLKGGQARKALMRLDVLLRLQTPIITAAVQAAMEALSPEDRQRRGFDEHSVVWTLEERMDRLTSAEIADKIALGNVRPPSTRVAPWWDIECDKHLLVGVYKYGFMHYTEIRRDPELCFIRKINEFISSNPLGANTTTARPAASKDTLLGPEVTWPAIKVMVKLPGQETERELIIPGKRRSQYRGVYSQPGSVMWVAQLQGSARMVIAGYFESEVEAAKAYDKEARALWGTTVEYNFNEKGERNDHVTSEGHELPLVWHRSSKYRGVRAAGPRWTAQISYGGTNHHLGTYNSEIEAALAYDTQAMQYHNTPAAVFNFTEGPQSEFDRIDAIVKELTDRGELGEVATSALAIEPVPKKRKSNPGAPKASNGLDAEGGVGGAAAGVSRPSSALDGALPGLGGGMSSRPPMMGVQGMWVRKDDDDDDGRGGGREDDYDDDDVDDDDDVAPTPVPAPGEPVPAPVPTPGAESDGKGPEEAAAMQMEQKAPEVKPEGASTVAEQKDHDQQQEAMDVDDARTESVNSTTAVAAGGQDGPTSPPRASVKRDVSALTEASVEGGDDGDRAGTPGLKDEDGEQMVTEPAVVDEAETLLQRHWPESKVLNKLVNWLIEDPEAKLTQEEADKVEELKKAQKVRRAGTHSGHRGGGEGQGVS